MQLKNITQEKIGMVGIAGNPALRTRAGNRTTQTSCGVQTTFRNKGGQERRTNTTTTGYSYKKPLSERIRARLTGRR